MTPRVFWELYDLRSVCANERVSCDVPLVRGLKFKLLGRDLIALLKGLFGLWYFLVKTCFVKEESEGKSAECYMMVILTG